MKNRSKKTNKQPNGKARDHKMYPPKKEKKGVEQSKAVQKKMALIVWQSRFSDYKEKLDNVPNRIKRLDEQFFICIEHFILV